MKYHNNSPFRQFSRKSKDTILKKNTKIPCFDALVAQVWVMINFMQKLGNQFLDVKMMQLHVKTKKTNQLLLRKIMNWLAKGVRGK